MEAVFLSASVPVPGRGSYHDTASPFLIQAAVRELVISVVPTRALVWGGHPAITPMIWAICEDLGRDYSNSVVLYQSRFFEDQFPEESERFQNVVFVDAVSGDLDRSLAAMREAMVARSDLIAGVFIGGMEGLVLEHEIFRRHHPEKRTLLVAAPGGATLELASRLGRWAGASLRDVDFARIFRAEFS